MTLLTEGKKTSAVKTLMAMTGAGISDAKTAIESLEARGIADSLTPLTPEPASPDVPASPPSPGLKLPGQAVQPPERPRVDQQPAPPGTAWLKDWKGRRHKTRKQVLNAICQACGHAYQLSGSALNEYADQMGASGKLDRFLEVANLWANSGDPNSGKAAAQLKYNRDRAEAQATFDAKERAVFACVCPACRSDQVLVESPK